MALCTVTGAVYFPSGELARSVTIKFSRVDKSVNAEYLGAVVPADVYVKTDRLGQVDFEILTGRYIMAVGDYSGGAQVPDALTANIADILTIVAPEIPVPAWLEQALSARDAALSAAASAAESANDAASSAADAAADAVVGSEALLVANRAEGKADDALVDSSSAALVAARARDAAGVVPQQFGDGSGGWQVAINAAIDALSSGQGGKLVLPDIGVPYSISNSIVMRSNVILDLGGSTLFVSSGSNCEAIEGLNYSTLTGTNSGSGISEFSIINGVIDGNRAANTSTGHGIAFYGRNFFLKDLFIKNTRQRGLHSEYGNTTVGISPFNGRVHNLTFDTCGEEGWYNEVSDCQGGNLNFASTSQNADNTFDAMVMVKGSRISEAAIWRKGIHTNRHRYGVRVMGGSTVTMVNVETSATAAWRIESEVNQVSDTYSYNNMGASNVEIAGNGNRFSGRIGRASLGELNAASVSFNGFCSSNDVDIVTSGLGGNSLLLSSYSGGYNNVRLRGSMDSSGSLLSGSPFSTDELDISLQVGSAAQEIKKRRVTFTAVAAAGTTQATATLLSRVINNVSGADGTNGVVMPTGYEGREITVSNISATSSLNVYPAVGQIMAGFSTNAPRPLAATLGVTFIYNGGRWIEG